MLFNCVIYTCSKLFCGLSWDKPTVCCFYCSICQLGISKGSFTVPQFHTFLSSLFDVPYNATFHSPALCSSNWSRKKYKLSMAPRDLFPIGFDFQTLVCMCSRSRTFVRRCCSFGDSPFIAMMKEGVLKSLWFCLKHNVRAHNSIFRLLISSRDMPNFKLKYLTRLTRNLPDSKLFLCVLSNAGTFFWDTRYKPKHW